MMNSEEKKCRVLSQRRNIDRNRVVIAFSVFGIGLCVKYILNNVTPAKADQKS